MHPSSLCFGNLDQKTACFTTQTFFLFSFFPYKQATRSVVEMRTFKTAISLAFNTTNVALIGFFCVGGNCQWHKEGGIKTLGLCCSGIRTYIRHTEKPSLWLHPLTPTPPRPSPATISSPSTSLHFSKMDERGRDRHFIPPLSCLHFSEKRTISLTHCTANAAQQPFL